MTIEIVPFDCENLLSWQGLLRAFEAGHRLAQPDIKDLFVYRGADTLLRRKNVDKFARGQCLERSSG